MSFFVIFIYHLQGGRGLHLTLNSHSRKFIGVLNGIDTDAWNPSTDAFLKVQYNVNDIEGKTENKEAIRRSLGLSCADVRKPLVTFFLKQLINSFVMQDHHVAILSFV